MFIRVIVEDVLLDAKTRVPVLMLKDAEGEMSLPVWIGIFEATAIVVALQEITPERPLTHDLMNTLTTKLDGRVERVEVDGLDEGVFFAKLHIALPDGEKRVVDCRPSDAVALALRANAPVYVASHLMESSGILAEDQGEKSEEDEEHWKQYLQGLDSSAFGKYKM